MRAAQLALLYAMLVSLEVTFDLLYYFVCEFLQFLKKLLNRLIDLYFAVARSQPTTGATMITGRRITINKNRARIFRLSVPANFHHLLAGFNFEARIGRAVFFVYSK